MNYRALLTALATTTALAGTSPAMAGAEVGSWYVSPKATYVNPDKEFNADSTTGGSLAFGKVLSKAWDIELAYVDTRHDVTGGGDKLKLAGAELNINRVFVRDKRVSPFIGVGINSLSARDLATGGNSRDVGASIRAGLLADLTSNGALQLSAEMGKRADDFSQNLEDMFGSVGLRFNFGVPVKAAAPVVAPVVAVAAAPVVLAAPADSDHDGVIDSADQCPNTVAGAKVDAKGCELDGDRDGVVDRLDKCPNTPAGDKVDAVGCSYSIALQVQFDTNSATIKQESFTMLDTFAQFFTNVPSAKGELQGHTDNVGKDSYNLKLSQRRADSVKAYLVGKGVDAGRISAKGFGETKPVSDNATEEGRAANRRVMFVRSDVTH